MSDPEIITTYIVTSASSQWTCPKIHLSTCRHLNRPAGISRRKQIDRPGDDHAANIRAINAERHQHLGLALYNSCKTCLPEVDE